MSLTYYEGLENSLSEEIKNATQLVLSPLPDPTVELSIEELEKELLELSALHHICARMKSRGKSLNEVVASLKHQYGYHVTVTQVSYMIQKVLNLNFRMTPRSTELLRQQIDEQLDSLIAGAYATATEDGRDYLNPLEAKIMLSVIDRKIKLHGLDAPIEIKHSMSDEIRQLQEDLYQKLDNLRNREVIEMEGLEDWPKEK